MRASASRLRWGTLAAPYNSSTPPAVSKRARTPRLDWYAAVAADCQIEGDDRMRRDEGCLDIAVTGAQHQCFSRLARCETAGSRADVQYRRQLIGLDRNQLGGTLGQIRIGCEHRRDRLCDIAQPLPRQEWLAIVLTPESEA
jgi:hypothetical protein